jgi:hypothetical protein
MQPLGLSTTRPVIGNQSSVKNASTNITGTSASPSLLNTNTPDTATLFGTMLGLLGSAPAAGNQILSDPVSGFTYNTAAANPFLTPAASPNINLAELFNALPTQFWNALLSLLMNPQVPTGQAVPLNADPTSSTAAITDPPAQIPAPSTGTAAKTNTGTASKTKSNTGKKDEKKDKKSDAGNNDAPKDDRPSFTVTATTVQDGKTTTTETKHTIIKGTPTTGQVAQTTITETTDGKVTKQTTRNQREIST